jgi:hypothetical protein
VIRFAASHWPLAIGKSVPARSRFGVGRPVSAYLSNILFLASASEYSDPRTKPFNANLANSQLPKAKCLPFRRPVNFS